MIGKYKTVWGYTMEELDDKVNDALNRHWDLYESPYTFNRTITVVVGYEKRTNEVICQALYHPNSNHDSDNE